MTRQYGQEVAELAEKSAEKSAKAMERDMKRIAPRDTGTLISTIQAVQEGANWTVYSGGDATTRKIGKRTYDRVVEVGRGRVNKGAKKKAGGMNVTADYAGVVEFGTKDGKRKADPYHRPSRAKARKSHRARVNRELNKLAKRHSS